MMLTAIPGEVTMVASTLVYAVQALIAKFAEREITALELVVYRSVLAGTLTLRLVLKTRTTGPIDERLFGPRDYRLLVMLRGIMGGSAFVLLYSSLHLIGVGEFTALFFLNPVFISLLAWPVLGEPMTLVSWCAVVLGSLGTLCVASPPWLVRSSDPTNTRGTALVLAGAMLVASTLTLVRKIAKNVDTLCLALSFHLFSACLGANGLFLGFQTPAFPRTPRCVLLIVAVSLTSFLGQPLLNHSFQVLPAARAASLNYLQLLWGFVLGILFNNERPSLLKLVGAAIIASAGLVVALCGQQSKKPVEPTLETTPLYDREAVR